MLGPQSLLDPRMDTRHLDELLLVNGKMKALPAAELDALATNEQLRHWCHRHGRYGLPTAELIDWLRARIADRYTIEIGAGYGDFASLLGISATDSKIQCQPAMIAYYDILGQPVIKYPADVEQLDAAEAVKKYRPQVVLASWVTQWVDPHKPPTPGSVFGVKEWKFVDKVTYILIGNIATHGQKRIMAKRHEVYDLPFLRSRASNPELNRVWIWE
jgi:hypothetical protein